MPDLSPNDEEDFLERLRSVWNESVEFEGPSPEALAKAKQAFRQHQRQKRRRRLVLILVVVIFLAAAAVLLIVGTPP